jgi:hypothetical protein
MWYNLINMEFFSIIKTGIISVGVALVSLFGVQAPVVNQVNLGASNQTPDVRALFSTTLASRISSTDTSMTLVSATDKDGNTLASSTYGFIIDEGTSAEEFVLADCTGTTCTNMTRGLSIATGTTTVSALRFEHRRGASVKITDAPSLIFAMNVFNGRQNIENKLRYDSAQTFDNATDIISRDYADSLAFGAVPEATETAAGFGEVATGVEIASSTSSGSEARLLIPASLATSTYNSATAALKVVVTGNDGKIDGNFLSGVPTFTGTNTYTGINTFSTTTATSTMIGSFPAYHIGKNVRVITSTGTSTFAVPSGINKLHVKVVGAGGGGGYATASCSTDCIGGPGGGGGYAEEYVDVTGTSTIQYFVGTGGIRGEESGPIQPTAGGWTTFGTNGSYLYATGGTAGGNATSNGTIGSAGSGGTGVGGDVNLKGGNGTPFIVASTGAGISIGGSTVLSPFNAAGYGAGGGGNVETFGTAGQNGVIIITW